MNTKDTIIAVLEQFRSFFLTHNVSGWANRSERTIHAIRGENADLKSILRDFIGAGIGSLIDLFICVDNGHLVQTTEEDANRELSKLTDQILTLEAALQL